MIERIIEIDALTQLPEAAQQLLELFGNKKVVAFYGEMGTGKTTLIKAICHCLGVVDNVSSPTFSIVNEYFTKDRETVFHFDLYRLKNLWEALDIGIEEYLYTSSYCFIEWPEQVESLLPEDHVMLKIEKGDMPESRLITVS